MSRTFSGKDKDNGKAKYNSSSSSTVIRVSEPGPEMEPDVVVACRDLTVLTPDGIRVLIGGPISSSSSNNNPGPSTAAGGVADTTTITAATSEASSHGEISTAKGGVDIEIRRGDKILIVGPSGCDFLSFQSFDTLLLSLIFRSFYILICDRYIHHQTNTITMLSSCNQHTNIY